MGAVVGGSEGLPVSASQANTIINELMIIAAVLGATFGMLLVSAWTGWGRKR